MHGLKQTRRCLDANAIVDLLEEISNSFQFLALMERFAFGFMSLPVTCLALILAVIGIWDGFVILWCIDAVGAPVFGLFSAAGARDCGP